MWWRSGVWVVLGLSSVACSASDTGPSFSGQGGMGGLGQGGASGSSGGNGASGGVGGGAMGIPSSSKLDLLLVVDNSLGMTDAQDVLRRSVPDLLNAITAPGSPVTDLHVGVITTSLGSYGSTVCNSPNGTPPRPEEQNDMGHLLGTRPRAATVGVPTGIVTWTAGSSAASVVTDVQGLIGVAGEFGCGYEQTLESVYRFLADPKPPESYTVAKCVDSPTSDCATPTGVDQTLLSQRSQFLRADSELAIVVLSNENDCSTRGDGQGYYAMRTDMTLPHGSAACATNPNDPCCYACDGALPSGCTADPACATATDRAADSPNLRCFEQKRRFGYDFLYPVQRYVNALTNPTLCTSRTDLDPANCPDADGIPGPDLSPNPLFSAGASGRGASLIHLVSIVGVPWQTITTTGPSAAIHYPDGNQLGSLLPVIYGDPSASPPRPASDPLMVESIDPRGGTTPGTGEALAPPSAGYLANSVNGHEYPNTRRDDLQYACIYQLPEPKDCVQVRAMPDPRPLCECDTTQTGYEQNPQCQGSDSSYGDTRYFGKAYPGLRHIAFASGLGGRGAVASLCPRNSTDSANPDYAYRPAMDLVLRELSIPH